MLEKICFDVNGTTEVKVGENTINFKTPFKRITMLDAIKEHTGIDISGMDEAQLREVCKKIGVEVDETMGKGKSSTKYSARNAKAITYNPPSSPIIPSKCRRSPNVIGTTPN